MIYTLYGKVFEVDVLGGYAVIECGGVGYKITVSANTLTSLPMPEFDAAGNVTAEKNVRVYTHLAVREDGVELFGFYTKEELDAFKLLINVSGVGPKVALGVLSLFTPDKLYSAVAAEDVARAGDGRSLKSRLLEFLHVRCKSCLEHEHYYADLGHLGDEISLADEAQEGRSD